MLALAITLTLASAPHPRQAAAPLPGRKSIAVVRPAALDGAPEWVSLAVADNLATALLDHRRAGATSAAEYPLDVLTWREAASAARTEGFDTWRALPEPDARALARHLGVRFVFIASYRPKGARAITFQWRLVDVEAARSAREAKVVTNLATLAGRVDALAASVLRALGEQPAKATRAAKVPAAALTAYGRALEILAGQSLEPTAAVVLPPIELKKAQAWCERATKAAPRYARTWVAMALASAMLGDVARAEKEVLRATADEETFEALNALGPYYLYTRQGRPEDAIRALTDATTRRPGFLLGLGYLGNAYLRVGRARQAVEVFATYSARLPGSPWAKLMHARSLAFAGETEAALEETRAVVAASPESHAALSGLGTRLAQAGKDAEALEVLEAARAKHPDSAALLTRLAYVHLRLEHPEAALELAKRAIAALGDARGEQVAGYAYADMGHALALLGQRDEAHAAFAKAAELGIDVEDRLLLLADPRAKEVLEEVKSPILRDAPPPPRSVNTADATPVDDGEIPDESEGVAADDQEVWAEDEDGASEDAELEAEQAAAAAAPVLRPRQGN